ncbi:MATE family efflux transporter [Clostridium sp. D2Q-14]|uniref:MATE family efflux transporter n=1 Tax=Anaeromonas gelatinilytica TaxID=2683194 RepID=UPI00193BBAA5|nr:MATE family efflux transporter [Anaeromonas gelatinilytica]MBS4535621.1 MATE family efflux transporter [Anaeromonas gelatinilytica]
MISNIDFINDNTRKSFIKMSLPMMAAMFLNLAYNIMDSIWVGNLLGETAMAALTSSTPVILLLTAIGMGATNGLSIILSQKIGAGDKKQVDSLVTTSFVSALLFSVVLTIVLELGLPTILNWLNTRSEIFDMAYDYLAIYLLGYISTFLYLYFAALLRSYGNTSLQAISILICTILDCILNPIFIRWIGFNGAAITTIVSESISVLILVIYMIRKKMFSLHFSMIDFHFIPPMVKNALPSIVQQSIPAISTSFLTAVISGFSVTAIAGYGITGKLETILLYPAMAFNMVMTTIIGQCIGGKRADRANEYLKCSIFNGGAIVLGLSVIVVIFAKPLSRLFVNTSGVAELVSMYFLIVGVGYVFNTITNCLLGTINGMGKPTVGMLLMTFYYLVVRMPLAWILSKSFLGLDGVWLAVLISHIVACLSATLYYLIYRKKSQIKANNIV